VRSTPFPPIDPSFGNPVVAGAGLVVAFEDDPVVARLVRYLNSPEAGRIWVSHGTEVSPNKLIPLNAYPTSSFERQRGR
jgi:alpha-glucoside transport system substrate-binding protein